MVDTFSLDKRILNDMADATIYADKDGIIQRWNPAAVALFGFTIPEAVGQSLDLIIPDRLRVAHWEGFRAAMAAGNTKLAGRPTLTRATHKQGRKLYVEMTFALVKDDKGTPLGAVAVARDVTEREEARRSNDRT